MMRHIRLYVFLIGLVVGFGGWLVYAVNVDPQRPAQSLYRVRWGAAAGGWTPELHLQAANLLADMGDLRAAVHHWRIAQPDDPINLQRLANAEIALQQWDSAAGVLRRILTHNPQSQFAHYHLGLILAGSDPLTAAGHLANVIEAPAYASVAGAIITEIDANAADPALSLRIGLTLLDAGEWAFAERAFRHAVVWSPAGGVAAAYVGLARQRQGKDGDSWLVVALDVQPDSATVHYVHGLYLRGRGDDVASLNAFAQAIRWNPDEPAYYAELGRAHQLNRDLETAAHWLAYAARLSNYAPAYVESATRFHVEEAYPVEDETLRAMMDGVSADNNAVLLFGWSLHLNNESEEALIQIDSVLSREPDSVDALYYRARILLEVGRYSEAAPLLDALAGGDSIHRAWADEMRNTLPAYIQDESEADEPETE